MEFKETLLSSLRSQFPNINFTIIEFKEELTIQFDKKFIIDVCDFLKNNETLSFMQCIDVTAIDWAKQNNRFTISYNLFSLKNKFRLRLECAVDEEDCAIESICSVWASAEWYERETYDMYGILFLNHPDPRRMYMPEEFEHHPLKKDFPVMGIPGSLSLPKK